MADLKSYLSEIAIDSTRLGKFLLDPEEEMESAGLNDEDKLALRAGLPAMIAARLAGAPAGAAFTPEAGRPPQLLFTQPQFVVGHLVVPPPQQFVVQPPPQFVAPQFVVHPPPQFVVQPPPQFVVQPPPQFVAPQFVVHPPPQFVVQPPPQFVVQPPPQFVAPQFVVPPPPQFVVHPPVQPLEPRNAPAAGLSATTKSGAASKRVRGPSPPKPRRS
jgi:hypothetical protein